MSSETVKSSCLLYSLSFVVVLLFSISHVLVYPGCTYVVKTVSCLFLLSVLYSNMGTTVSQCHDCSPRTKTHTVCTHSLDMKFRNSKWGKDFEDT